MAKGWLTDFAERVVSFADLQVVQRSIINANFTEKIVTAAVAPSTQPTVALGGITEGIFGRKVFIMVDTQNMQGEDVTIELIGHDDGTNDVLNITDGTADVCSFTATVGDTTALDDAAGNNPYSNLVDFADKAIFKIDIRPHARKDFDDRAQQINTSADPSIKIQVKPADNAVSVCYGASGNEDSTSHPDGFIFGNYDLENKNVYEIYHEDNPFNPLGTHIHNGQVVNKRIATLENDNSADVVYFYHNISDNVYEICTCVKSQVRRRANGRKVASTSAAANVPTGYADSQNAPAGGDAATNYYYNHYVPSPLATRSLAAEPALPATFVPNLTLQANFEDYHTIVSIGTPGGTDYGVRRYALVNPSNPNDLVDLIRMPNTLNISEETGINQLILTFAYRNTARRYCNPSCFAGFLSALAQLGRNDVVCTGMCFEDATSYPSVTHPNGDSVDTAYLSNLADEQLKVNAFRDNYFTNIYRGNTGWYGSLVNTNYSGGHEDHLHSGDFDNNKVKTLN